MLHNQETTTTLACCWDVKQPRNITVVATVPEAWRQRVSAGTGWAGVTLWLGEIASLMCLCLCSSMWNCLSTLLTYTLCVAWPWTGQQKMMLTTLKGRVGWLENNFPGDETKTVGSLTQSGIGLLLASDVFIRRWPNLSWEKIISLWWKHFFRESEQTQTPPPHPPTPYAPFSSYSTWFHRIVF